MVIRNRDGSTAFQIEPEQSGPAFPEGCFRPLGSVSRTDENGSANGRQLGNGLSMSVKDSVPCNAARAAAQQDVRGRAGHQPLGFQLLGGEGEGHG